MTEDTPEPAISKAVREMVENFAARLIEHVDGVQIFVQKYDPTTGKTAGLDNGKGNWYSRYGHVQEWVIEQDSRTAEDATG